MLEYLKVLLTTPVMAGLVALYLFWQFGGEIKALINRIATIRFGGAEVVTQQKLDEVETKKKPIPPDEQVDLPNLSPEQVETVQQLLKSERANAYLWEYRFLNYFLVYHTQMVLNWLCVAQGKVGFAFYDSYWLPLIPSPRERQAVISALQNHYLIVADDSGMEITPKGLEYVEWRGALPPLPSK